MPRIRPFEIALVAGFVIAALVGVFMLSTHKSDTEKAKALYGNSLNIWGTVDESVMWPFLKKMSDKDNALNVVQYHYVDPRSFESELVNAIAEGRAPELILVPHTFLASLRPKLQPIPYSVFPERTFRDTYIDGASIFMLSDGVYGFPVAVDPLVMYWNRDLFSSNGLAQPPQTWESLVGQTAGAITRVDDQRRITQSTVSFGEYSNVAHAKDILAMLFLQAGSTLVDERNSSYTVTLNQSVAGGLLPGDSVLPFYTQFASPGKSLYSWNRSLPLDRTAFLENTLALYFGFGSERPAIERESPNLNFDMTEVPQGSGATIRRDYGTFYAFAIPRGSKNPTGAYAIATLFGSAENAKFIADALNMAPVHRSQMGATNGDIFKSVIYQSALIARGWLDPDPNRSGPVIQQLIEEAQTSSGRLQQIVNDAAHRLQALF